MKRHTAFLASLLLTNKMRIFYPVKAAQLLLALAALALLLKNKKLCTFKDPRSVLFQPYTDCHTSLIDGVFRAENNATDNATLLGETNETAPDGPPSFTLSSCIRIYESDIYHRPSKLQPLLFVLLPVCLLVVETFLIVLQTARVVTSYNVPDNVSTILGNLLHAICWLGSSVTLCFVRLYWQQNWMKYSPEFVPVYPTEFEFTEEVAWFCVVALLLESTLCRNVVYHNLILEEPPSKAEEPPVLVATFRDEGGLLDSRSEE